MQDGMCFSTSEAFIQALESLNTIADIKANKRSLRVFIKGQKRPGERIVKEVVDIWVSEHGVINLRVYFNNSHLQNKAILWNWFYGDRPTPPYTNPDQPGRGRGICDIEFCNMGMTQKKKQQFQEMKAEYGASQSHAHSRSFSTQIQSLQRKTPSRGKVFGSIGALSLLAGAGAAALYAYKTGLFAASAFTLSMLASPVAIMFGVAIVLATVLSLVALRCMAPKFYQSESKQKKSGCCWASSWRSKKSDKYKSTAELLRTRRMVQVI